MGAPSPEERAHLGAEARTRVPLASHRDLETSGRADPVRVLAEQATSRTPELVPLRHHRMLASPFAFFRGGAALMAADLVRTPSSGIDVQLCGDAHVANFGLFGSPERNLLFDLNDFDETCRGPWEWDLKRLATSLVVAGRANGFPEKKNRRAVVAAAQRYRAAMTDFAGLGNLAVWYARVDPAQAKEILGDRLDDRMRARVDASVAKARTRDHLRSLGKLTEVVDGRRRIVADPPLVVPVSTLAPSVRHQEVEDVVGGILEQYAASLDPVHRALVSSYSFVDLAHKVVGVGSVGTRCWIVLMRGRDDDDPLFLQVKEAQESVVARRLPDRPVPDNQGERVVRGQRLMQAASDLFLGWHRTTGLDGRTRDFYVRQLHDWKGSADLEALSARGMRLHGELCAWTLARAHARTGDRIAVAAYLGDGDDFAEALADFASAYADVNEQDHASFAVAVDRGELTAAPL
jgi:uncharacterized protein (DUF2252 family)